MEKDRFNLVKIMSYTDEKGIVHKVSHSYCSKNKDFSFADTKALLYEIFMQENSKGE